MSGAPPYRPLDQTQNEEANGDNEYKKARVLYDYDAKDVTELSLMGDEVSFLFFLYCRSK